MNLRWFKRHRAESEMPISDSSVQMELDRHEAILVDFARRLRLLEIEAGIYKPPITLQKGK